MNILGITVVFLLYTVCSLCEKITVSCPQYCECDIFEDRRRAVCVDSRLVTVEAFIPNITQILDLSFNQIVELQDHIFYDESLLSLQLLNISHNILSHIHINAFYGLNDLKTLDVSFNSLQYILPNWFWSLQHLEELYLSGNRFGILSEGPLFESKSLKVLDMSQCKVSSFGSDVFIKIAKLNYLDISNNDLIQLDLNTITPLKSLQTLKLNGNPFKCNENMKNITSYCIQSRIEYTDPCKQITTKGSKGSRKLFEKIVLSTTESTIMKNSWIYDQQEDICNTTKIVEICPNKTVHRRLVVEILELSPELSLLITLVSGILIGLIIGCGVQIRGSLSSNVTAAEKNEALISRKPRSFTGSNSLRRNTFFKSTHSLKSRRNEDDNQNLVLMASDFPDSSPLLVRKFDT